MKHCYRVEETHETTRKRKASRWLLRTFKDRKRNYMKSRVYLKQQLLKDTFATKRYGKGLLFKIKEEVYKIITEKEFTKKRQPFERAESQKNINTQWGTVYSRGLVEFTKKKIMAMWPKDDVDICVPRRNDDKRLMRPTIFELDFEKVTLDPHIIIRRGCI